MRKKSVQSLATTRKGKMRREERGVTLITTLLLLLLMTAMALTMVLSVSSDMLINGYYRNFRGAFYAADSGLNIARHTMIDQMRAAVPGVINAATPPIPAGTEALVLNNVLAAYGASTNLNQGKAAGSWPTSFRVVNTPATPTSLALAVTVPPQPTVDKDVNGNITAYHYLYNYRITAVGQSQGSEVATLEDKGSIKINANLGAPAGVRTSFAAWGMFIDQWAICSGGTLVPGIISGPSFTNGAWTFGTSGSYIFTDAVGSHSPNAGYQFSGTCDQKAASSDKVGTQTIAPNFQNGFNLNQPTVPLPSNDFNQKRSVLDGKGELIDPITQLPIPGAPVTNADLNNSLRNVNQTKYPVGGAASGVYLPYGPNGMGVNQFNGGGIYVEGAATSITITPSGATGQTYTIVQGGTTTTITIDIGANTTVMTSGGNTVTIQGVPTQRDPITNAVVRDATMLYVDGNITSLQGAGQGKAAIQDVTALTITAKGTVTVTGDILYKSEPVTLTSTSSTPADTLISANDHGQVLGIFTATGDIQLNNQQPNGNLEIDASIASVAQGGTGGLINVGSAIKTLTIVGGRIQNNIKNINATTRNVYFDRRFAQSGFAPPWFPSTVVAASGVLLNATTTATVQRVQWVNKSTF